LKKKILILTLPIGENYGGILQAYALQTYVRSLGFAVTTSASPGGVGKHWKRLVKRIPGAKNLARRVGLATPPEEYPAGHFAEMEEFITRNIEMAPFTEVRRHIGEYWAVIVGSDQVWREPYAALDRNYLAFVPARVKKLSYAASFGVDNITEYSWLQRSRARIAIRRFEGVSVREKSGVEICRSDLGVAAEYHLDPTMLLEAATYRELFESESTQERQRSGVLAYMLDRSGFAERVVQTVSHEYAAEPHEILGSSPRASVEKWLAEIALSSFVVTDSFHGTVFSILMHTPFAVVRNDERGAARIESLLEMFGLQDHLVAEIDGETARSLGTVNWAHVDRVLGEERRKAQAYLCGVLA
jgi:hypothetical protein